MLVRMSPTPSVTTVNRGIGAFGLSLIVQSPSKQAQLLPAPLRPREMVGGQLRAALVEPELFAGDLEPSPDHPGHWPSALHPRSPLRVVVAAAAHVTDKSEDMAITVGIIGQKPFAEQVAHF